MKPSTIFSILFCLLCFNQGFAQRQNVYFLKNSGVQVNLRDSADFIRVVSEPDSGTTLYNVKEYYKTGKIRLIGKTSKIEPLQLEGQCVTYFPSGKKRIYANYKDGRLEGDVFSYFPNGKPYAYKRYSQTPVTQGSGFREDYAIMACNDSVGKELVVNGNGYYIGYDSDFKNVVEEGNVKSGLRDGKWKGSNGNEKNYITFAEEYDNGKMISGQSVDKDGLVVNYTTRAYEPQFKNGIQAFYQFLASSMIYPQNARERNITGKVLVSFVVEKDGSLSDVNVIKNPNDELSAEALRVVKKSPKWIPGMQYGRTVRVYYTVPINFTLNGR